MFLLLVSISSHTHRNIKASPRDTCQPVTLLSEAGTSAPVWWGTAALPRLLAGGCGFGSPRSIDDTSGPLSPPPPFSSLQIPAASNKLTLQRVCWTRSSGRRHHRSESRRRLLSASRQRHFLLIDLHAENGWNRTRLVTLLGGDTDRVTCAAWPVRSAWAIANMSHGARCSFWCAVCSCYSSVHMEALLS